MESRKRSLAGKGDNKGGIRRIRKAQGKEEEERNRKIGSSSIDILDTRLCISADVIAWVLTLLPTLAR
jgi:hypothetical protein